MLKRNVEVFKHGQHLASEADLRVHQILFDVDDREALLASDAGDDIVRGKLRCGGDDHRAAVGGRIGVLDIDRNPRKTNREDRLFVQHGRAHVGELTQLTVGNGGNDFRILDDTRIGYQETGNIGPVLVDVSVYGLCHDGTSDIGSAAGEGFYASVRFCAVESRNDCVIQIF